MRRAVLILATSLAAQVVLGPSGSAAEVPLRDVRFELHEGGFLVTVRSEVSQEKIELSLARDGEVALYETDAEFTDDTVKARFGRLGELDYAFTPTRGGGRCAELGAGTYEGTFSFTGENEYVKFEADRASATVLGPESEKDEGMLIARGAQALAPSRDFTWNLKAGTAHISPPAPFTGSATFKRRPGARPRWSGSLRAPMLGGQPFRLAGGDVRAQLIEGSPID
jgi:hypothetical protein